MRIFDRYVIWTFLKNYLITFMVLVGLYVVLDMVFHFDEMFTVKDAAEGGSTSAFAVLLGIADFYFYQMLLFFVHLSGIIPVVAAAFTLMRLSRFNELTAMLAAGVPLLRLAMPIAIIGLILNGLLIVDQELLIPRFTHKLTRDHDEIRQAHASSFPVRAMQDENKCLLMAALYHPPTNERPATIEHLDVIERDPVSLQPVAHTRADGAVWDRRAGGWRLTNGKRTTGLLPEDRPATSDIDLFKTSITPDEIALYRSSDTVELLSSSRINRLLERPESYGKTDLLRVKHWRFVQPFSNFLILLLAIPCVLTREPASMKMAAMKCLMLTGACLTVLFLCHQIAGNPPAGSPEWLDRWPAILAWLPLFIFLPVAVWLLDRVKT